MASQQINLPSSEESAAILKRVFRENWRRYFWRYVLAFVFLVIVSACTAFPAYIVYNIINDVFVSQDLQTAYYIAAAIFIAFTLRGFATYGYLFVLGKIGNNIVARYQRRIYSHLLKLGIGFYKTNRSAYLVGQINQNIIGMRNVDTAAVNESSETMSNCLPESLRGNALFFF